MSRWMRDILLAFVGTILLLSQVIIQAKDGNVSALIIGAGMTALGLPLWQRLRNGNGNGGGK